MSSHYICTECGVVIEAVCGGGALYHCQGAGRMQETELPDDVLELAPSRHLLYHGIREHEPCTGQDLQDTLGKNASTVYTALDDLEDTDAVHTRPALNGHATIWATTEDALDVDVPGLTAD